MIFTIAKQPAKSTGKTENNQNFCAFLGQSSLAGKAQIRLPKARVCFISINSTSEGKIIFPILRKAHVFILKLTPSYHHSNSFSIQRAKGPRYTQICLSAHGKNTIPLSSYSDFLLLWFSKCSPGTIESVPLETCQRANSDPHYRRAPSLSLSRPPVIAAPAQAWKTLKQK